MSLILSLGPEGRLKATVPHSGGQTTEVSFAPGKELEGILRILYAQQSQQTPHFIGTPAVPTQQEVEHQEKHQVYPDSRCPFCKALRVSKSVGRPIKPQPVVLSDYQGVTIRRLAAKSPKIGKTKQTISLSDLEADTEVSI